MIPKLFFFFLPVLICSVCSNSYASEQKCDLDEFKSLYIKLQNELNYEKKDAIYNKDKHRIELVNHATGKEYGGKVF